MDYKKRYYVDTCIYLNLWQKEEVKGMKLWKYAKDFFEEIDEKDSVVYYSGFVLEELMNILSKEKFESERVLFEFSPNFKKAFLSEDELQKARQIEKDTENKISFFDIIHMLLAKKTNSVLITRDRKLIQISERYGIEAKRPEEL
ncbi:PIN domain-containing protein [Candidatus Pacearchaeota archaeon]|nr:PIN domain-containing protein [Candidatus Pacearchaeota archaeon]